MIGSLLFYGLYPLSWYLSNRFSAITNPGVSGSCVDGQQVCGGTDVPTSSGEKTLLGGKQEYAEEDFPNTAINGEQPKIELHGEIETMSFSTAAEMSSTGNGEERLLDHDGYSWVQLEQATHLHQLVCDMNLNELEPTQSTCSALHPHAVLYGGLSRRPSSGGTDPAESWIPAGTEEPEVSGAGAPLPKGGECWDEYAELQLEGKPSGVFDLRSLLSDSLTHRADERKDETETEAEESCRHGWHISTGPGLAHVVYCPVLQLPSMSYYPSFQHEEPLEVVWRVWEEVHAGRTSPSEPVEAPSSRDTKPECVSFHFTVMSYNILAQDLLEANPQLYYHCPLEALDWGARCPLLQQEILKWMPDILCLQEVQESHYREQMHPFLAQIGYKCVYKRRTGTKTDGCATCYRGDRFSEISVSLLEFLRPETELLDRDNVGIALLLQPVAPQGSSEVAAKAPPPVCIANTHLLFNPRRGDVKLAQLAIVLAEVQAMVQACESRGQRCNVILCGDLNAVPHMPLYHLITSGRLYYHGLPAWTVSGVEDLSDKVYQHTLHAPLWPSALGITGKCQYTASQEKCEHRPDKGGKLRYSHDFLLQLRLCPAACVRPEDLVFIPDVTDGTPDISRAYFPQVPSIGPTICHGLGLRSVYQHVLPGLGHPEVTTLHSEAGATVDYIFYTPKRDPSDHPNGCGWPLGGSLELTGYLSLLSEGDLWSMAGLPNRHFPSDHLSLLARFQLDLGPAS